jgi:rhodanese-related sulfurtransferase
MVKEGNEMKRLILFVLALIMIGLPLLAGGYDAKLAASYAELFAGATGPQTGKALHLMPAAAFVDAVKAGKPLVVLDIRTPAESGIYGARLEETLAIPLDQLFLPENLARIPTDQQVVVICKSGMRAAAAATALRHVGFDNVYCLKGGLMALAKSVSPKTAH